MPSRPQTAAPLRAPPACRQRSVALPAPLPELELAASGAAPWLYERAGGPTLLLGEPALALSARRHDVELRALVPDARALLGQLREGFMGYATDHEEDRLVLRFPPLTAHDAEERLLAPSPLSVLRALTSGLPGDWRALAFPPFCMGVLAFDHVEMFEDGLAPQRDATGFPDALFRLPASYVVAGPDGTAHAVGIAWDGDRALAEARTQALAARCREAGRVTAPAPAGPAPEPQADLDDAAFAALVGRVKTHIAAGDVFQIVPSRIFRAPCRDPAQAFAALRALNPSPVMFFLEGEGWTLFGATPETAVTVARDGDGLRVEVKPIAGTRPRGSTPERDGGLEAELRDDMKEVAEHMMLVDLGRNDVARVSVPGTRRVDQLMTVERYAHVMHLVSTVSGRLRPELDALHALAACMNVGTLTGAPKLRATQLLRRYEELRRGPYGGAVGWIAADGTMDTAVVIRSAFVSDGIAQVRAGAGVVQDSDPLAETAETRAKAASVLQALHAAEAAS